MKKRALFEASAIVAKLTSNDSVRSVEQDSSSIGRESAPQTTPKTAERFPFYGPPARQKRTVPDALDRAVFDLQSSGSAQTTSLDDGYQLPNFHRPTVRSTFLLGKLARLSSSKKVINSAISEPTPIVSKRPSHHRTRSVD